MNKCPKCQWPQGIDIRPDGVHSLSPHNFVLAERHKNVNIEILQCKNCGEISIAWTRTPYTEDEILEDIGDD